MGRGEVGLRLHEEFKGIERVQHLYCRLDSITESPTELEAVKSEVNVQFRITHRTPRTRYG